MAELSRNDRTENLSKDDVSFNEKIVDLLYRKSTSLKDILEIWRKIQDDIHKMQISVAAIPKEIREFRELFSRIERQGGFK